MKIHLAWIRVITTAAIVAGVGVVPAAAQYAPYRPLPQQQVPQQQAPAAAVPSAQAPYTWQQAPQTVAPYRPAAAPYPQTAAPYVPAAQYVPAATPQTPAQYPNGYPTYPALARRSDAAPQVAETQPLPAPEAPADDANGYNGYADGDAKVQSGQAGDYATNGYYPAPAGCECNQGYVDYGVSSYFDNPFQDSQWFGGIYFLYMERDNPTPVKLTVEIDHSVASDPYYPQANTTVLDTNDVEYDYREGLEVRFGSTFTICEPCDTGCYSGCNDCSPCAGDMYAWEVAWWGLDDDAKSYTYVQDVGYPTRIYGMKNFAGLEYDRDGTGGGYTYRPVNGYYGYALPVPDPGAGPYADGYLAVLAQHVRTNFKAQNLELNIFRFPVCQVACGGCNGSCGGGDAGCYGGAGNCGCQEECCPASFSMYGSCGVRYFRVDDDFMYANEFAEWSGGVADKAAHDGFYDGESNEMYYDVEVDNSLVGGQVGWTMNYNYACKWNFFCNSTFGLFNNHIEHMQQMWGGGGGVVRFAQGGEDFYVRSTKNDFAMMGELRLGGSYDISCNWRAVLAYRAVAIAGLATSTDQIPDEFTNPDWVAIIDSDNSMIIHGVQVGAECRY